MSYLHAATVFPSPCRVDAVDFHDSGEEESGSYDLIQDIATDETYK